MSNKANVSGHSGLPEAVELSMLAEKAEQEKRKRRARFEIMRDIMNSFGIAPKERRAFLIAFAKWLEQEEGGQR